MFRRFKTPAILLAANLVFVMAGCDEPTDPVATTPGVSAPAATNDAVPVTPMNDGVTANDVTATESTATESTATESTTNDVTANEASSTGVTATEPSANEPSANEATINEVAVNEATANEKHAAVCQLEEIGDSGVKGTVKFVQMGDKVTVTGEVTGLEPGKHGFHVHEKGDLSDKETGKSAGGHFNPTGQKHGKPSDAERHIGDLGNITANEKGVAKIDIQDKVISLHGDHSIIGKSIVVHVGEDKFTQPTGDAGARAAFGLIEKTDKP